MISGRSIAVSAGAWVALHLVLMVRGLSSTSQPALSVCAAVLVVAATAAALRPLLAGPPGLSTRAAVLVGGAPVAGALLVTPFLDVEGFIGYAHWWPGAVGPLLAALVLRRRALAAVGGASAAGMVLVVVGWSVLAPEATGTVTALCVPLLLWPLAGASTRLLLARASTTMAALGSSSFRATERADDVAGRGRAAQQLVVLAGPLLTAVASGAPATVADAAEARRVELAIRDELRAGVLLDDRTRELLRHLRAAGWAALVDDHGGLAADLARDTEERVVVQHLVHQVLEACAGSVRAAETSRSEVVVLVPTGAGILLTATVTGSPEVRRAVRARVERAAGLRSLDTDEEAGVLWLAVLRAPASAG